LAVLKNEIIQTIMEIRSTLNELEKAGEKDAIELSDKFINLLEVTSYSLLI